MPPLRSGLVLPDTVEPSNTGTQTDTGRVFVSMFYGYHVVLFSRRVSAHDKRLNNGRLYHFKNTKTNKVCVWMLLSLHLSVIDASYGAINKPKIVLTKSKHDHRCKQ